MKLAQLDQWAVNRQGRLHSLSATTKLLGSLLLLAGLLAVARTGQLAALLGLLLSLLLVSGLPVRVLLLLACYPAVFSLPFALLSHGRSAQLALLMPLRALSAGVLLLLVLATTPYPQLLAVVSRWLPPLIGDALLLTYRLFFVMLGFLEQLLISMRLRGAFTWRNLGWSVAATWRALGLLLVQTVGSGERLYQALELRGYQGRLTPDPAACRVSLREGALLCLLTLTILGVFAVG